MYVPWGGGGGGGGGLHIHIYACICTQVGVCVLGDGGGGQGGTCLYSYVCECKCVQKCVHLYICVCGGGGGGERISTSMHALPHEMTNIRVPQTPFHCGRFDRRRPTSRGSRYTPLSIMSQAPSPSAIIRTSS